MERILFLGLGYIGLPTAALAASRGLEVVGVDVDPAIVGKVNRGEIHIVEPGLAEAVREAVSAGRLRASLEPVPGDVYVVVVPTPFKGNHEPDVSYVEAATRSVVPLLKEDDLFVIESTSPVGTTDRMARLIFAERPGWRMWTRGCLLANSISSQTLIPALSQINDSSLAKAICTSREEFSVSLHISAVFASVA